MHFTSSSPECYHVPESASLTADPVSTDPGPCPSSGHFFKPCALVAAIKRSRLGISPQNRASPTPKPRIPSHCELREASAHHDGRRFERWQTEDTATPSTTGHINAQTPQTPDNGGQSLTLPACVLDHLGAHIDQFLHHRLQAPTLRRVAHGRILNKLRTSSEQAQGSGLTFQQFLIKCANG